MDGFITGIRFYKGSGDPGTYVGSLWTSAGVPLGSVSFDNANPPGWQQQPLLSPVPISANTTYVVSYHTANGYAYSLNYFTSGVDNYPLRALADGEDGANGVYAYGPSPLFPTRTYNSANYWVDVVMVTATDNTPPTIQCPADVVLAGAECNIDPSITGTATATDDSGSVRVSYSDSVSGVCPEVVKRTWTAADAAGNAASCEQTITLLPACLVTDGSGCVFDRDSTTPVQDFRLIFIQDPQNWPSYRLAASNPGQFFYSVFYTGSPGEQVTFDITLPYPFVTQGANPIHAYDGVTAIDGSSQQCLTPGHGFFVSSQQVRLADYGLLPAASATIPVTLIVPASGLVCLTIHLDYGLKGTGGYTMNLLGDAVVGATPPRRLIPNHSSYVFSVGGAQVGETGIQNCNSFKRIPGVAGLVQDMQTLDPVPNAAVALANAKGATVGSAITDEDGFYMIAYKHTGKVAPYAVSVNPPEPYSRQTQSAQLKANAFVRLDFLLSAAPKGAQVIARTAASTAE